MPRRADTVVLEPTSTHYPEFSPADPVWSFANLPMPIIYEDEGEGEMGEASYHTTASQILHIAIEAHLRSRPELQVFANLNCYYDERDLKAYCSPDIMVVQPYKHLPPLLRSYRIGKHGPPPLLAVEVLSRWSFQQRDLVEKPVIYAKLGVAEYILTDVEGEFFPERLQLRRLRKNGTYAAYRDADGGVTSRLGFRIVIEPENKLCVLDANTGKRYLRPREAQAAFDAEQEARRREADAKRQAQERIRELEAELKRLRKKGPRS